MSIAIIPVIEPPQGLFKSIAYGNLVEQKNTFSFYAFLLPKARTEIGRLHFVVIISVLCM